MDSSDIILEWYGGEPLDDEKKKELAEEKNDICRGLLETMTPADVSDEVRETLTAIRKMGYRIALGSSSKNAKFILERVEMLDAFGCISDGTNIVNPKPDPVVFLRAEDFLGENPADCLVVEGAEAGIKAAIAGGMKVAVLGELYIAKRRIIT